MMQVLLDTNVILDALLQRVPWHVEADAILKVAAGGQLVCAATSLSLANVFYVVRRAEGRPRHGRRCGFASKRLTFSRSMPKRSVRPTLCQAPTSRTTYRSLPPSRRKPMPS